MEVSLTYFVSGRVVKNTHYELPVLLSRHFNEEQLGRPTVDKEGVTIVSGFKWEGWMVCGGVNVLCSRINLA